MNEIKKRKREAGTEILHCIASNKEGGGAYKIMLFSPIKLKLIFSGPMIVHFLCDTVTILKTPKSKKAVLVWIPPHRITGHH